MARTKIGQKKKYFHSVIQGPLYCTTDSNEDKSYSNEDKEVVINMIYFS